MTVGELREALEPFSDEEDITLGANYEDGNVTQIAIAVIRGDQAAIIASVNPE